MISLAEFASVSDIGFKVWRNLQPRRAIPPASCLGSARAPRAVFRALAKNPRAPESIERPCDFRAYPARAATVRASVPASDGLLRNAGRVPQHPGRVRSPEFYPRFTKCVAPKCLGSACAPRAVFRARAKNPGAPESIERPCQLRAYHGRAGMVRASVSASHGLLRNARRVPQHPGRVRSPEFSRVTPSDT